MTNIKGASLPISQAGMAKATQLLGVSPAEVWTVLSVETHGFGYLNDRRPAILFERHIFHKQTAGRFGAAYPAISSPAAGGYLGSVKEYDRLAQAAALDPHAALMSASWGIGQVMGFNFAAAGFDNVEAMVAAMVESEDSQLEGMAAFVRAQGLNKPLANHDWAGFAKGYNGPDFAKNSYDARLGSAFQRFAAGPLPDLRVRQAQALLGFLGFDAGAIDGVVGKRTRSAVAMFRGNESDNIDDGLITALRAKLTAAAASA